MASLLWNTATTAEYLGISKSTVYRYVEKNELPHIKKSFGLRYRLEDLDDWLEEDRRKSRLADTTLKNALTNLPTVIIDKTEGGQGAMAKAKIKRLNCGYGYIYVRPTKSGKPRFYLDYRDATGKRKQELDNTATCQEDALIMLRNRVQREHDKQNGIVRRRKNIGFTEFAEVYLESYARVAKKSWRTDEFRLRKLNEFFGNVDLREITPLMIQRYRAARLEEGISELTTNREIALLKKMFSMAIEEDYLGQNPAKKIKLYSERDTVRDRVLSEDEEKRLFSELADHAKPFVLAALHTGIRYRKLLELAWKDVNMEKRFIKLDRTKGKKSRYIPINSVLYEELKRMKSRHSRDPRVFPFKSVRTAFDNACRRASIEGFTFHDLRRTFGTRLLERGVDIVTISKLYGHSSVLVTQGYLHPKDELSREAVELLVGTPVRSDENDAELLHIRYTGNEREPLIN